MEPQTYYPFGMAEPGRNFSTNIYRYGFNGKEKDDEVKGNGNSLDFGARMYDSRLGRWMSRDPLSWHYQSESPYSGIANNPIAFIDPLGNEITIATTIDPTSGRPKMIVTIIGVVSFGHYSTNTSDRAKKAYVEKINSALQEIFSQKYEDFDVEFKSEFKLGDDKDIKPSDHVIYITNLHTGPYKVTGDNVGGFANIIGGRKAYFPASAGKVVIAHEIGHWLGLWHPRNLADNASWINAADEKLFGLFSYDNLMHHPADKVGKVSSSPDPGIKVDRIQAKLMNYLYNQQGLNQGSNTFNATDFLLKPSKAEQLIMNSNLFKTLDFLKNNAGSSIKDDKDKDTGTHVEPRMMKQIPNEK
ncbi:MAG TPA: RHS repeat-associated core domain-containing protein [Bacteroidia bacterium]